MSDAIAIRHGNFGRIGLFELDKRILPHVHREPHLVFNVRGASGSATVEGQDFRLDQKLGLAIGPLELHSFQPTNDAEPCACLVLYLAPEWALRHSQFTLNTSVFGRNQIHTTANIRRLIKLLTNSLIERSDHRKLDDFVYEILWRCFEQSWSQLNSELKTTAVHPTMASPRILKSLKSANLALSEPPGILDLAREAGLSRPHFFSVFKAEVGVSPNHFVNTLRIEHAADELITTDKSIEEIGFNIGFSNSSSFSRFFSSNVGVPPSVYRRAGQPNERSA